MIKEVGILLVYKKKNKKTLNTQSEGKRIINTLYIKSEKFDILLIKKITSNHLALTLY